MSRRAWTLNLSAEDELAAPSAVTLAAAREAQEARYRALLVGLVPDGDLRLDELSDPAAARGCEGRAWCPTPSVLRRWSALGVRAPPVPAMDVLRAVNHRRFCHELGPAMPGARFLTDERSVADAVRETSFGAAWVLKRPYSFRGGGRLLVPAGPLAPRDLAWVQASLRRDGLQVEPWVPRVRDLSLHGFLRPDKTLVAGELTAPTLDERSRWSASTRATDLSPDERRRWADELSRVARALGDQGYHGPFNLDGFVWTSPDGALHTNYRCEVNARYTMGWAVGMGDRRPDLETP